MTMVSLTTLFFSSHVLLLLITQSLAQPDLAGHFCFNGKGNYTTNSTYQTNLDTLLSSLVSTNGNGYGFYNSSYAENSTNQVYATGLCRGDVVADTCRSCLKNSSLELRKLCPNQKEALGFYDTCMLRYSNRSLYGLMEDYPPFTFVSTRNLSSSEVEKFFEDLGNLFRRLSSEAAAGGSLRKFAANNTTSGFKTIYALAQCTPDLSEELCTDCLAGAYGDIPTNSYGKDGARIVKPSCNIRYEISPFYDLENVAPLPSSPPISAPSPSTNTTNSEGTKSNKSRTIILVVVAVTVSLVLIVCICIYLRVRKTKKNLDQNKLPGAEDADEIRSAESLQFDFGTIRVATDDFSEANKLGQGGFGSVYRGKLSDGEEIAVKRLSMDSGQGDSEFKNEVLLVARLQHRNLVRLLGFCLQGNERLLVYEFVPNSSLDHIIFDPIKRAQLDWDKRYKIIEGIARGLLYLHEDSRLRIIHRDLKASNILIDAELNSKISDFGMARLFVLDETQGNTSRIVGTYGYMAPEYAMHGHFSVKSDVYSFGVLILEIISGQKNSCFRQGENMEDLPSYAWKSWREGTTSNLIDPTLTNGSRTEIMRCIHIGLLCVQENIADRPTMTSVILMLNSHSLSLPVPSEPAFFMHSSVGSDLSLGWESSSGVTASKSNFVSVKVPENEAALISEVYPR
ncbi:cysteine-rich receptor-like protein kinase 29 isoform X2 [Rosa rugosa]|uniref:cysteine-rich receptor-like protein kinase 29 isoform X2 n=1 Tax=Rosa rugosa TaxID=74645 RepID=UPI002B408598|nr:cysteine-rich receptor-like protein kinase 29 isoform X2 [Rosa rugosa]